LCFRRYDSGDFTGGECRRGKPHRLPNTGVEINGSNLAPAGNIRTYTQAGRSNPVFNPPVMAPTFITGPFNPATDY
jgi:hypothetical protein